MSEPEPGIGGRRLPIPRGRVMGGSSAINGAVYNRGHPNDFTAWTEIGMPEWDFAHLLPYFLRLEDHWRGGDVFHGQGGPMAVNKIVVRNPLMPLALETVKKLGYPLSDDWLGTEPEGWGLPGCNVDRKGRRATAARAFIDPIRGRKSLTIHSGAQVRRILMEGHRAVGIEYVVDGQCRIAHADRQVILSAGAIDVYGLGEVQKTLCNTPAPDLYEISVRSDTAAVAMRWHLRMRAHDEHGIAA